MNTQENTMMQAHMSQGEMFDLRQYWQIVDQYKWKVLSLTVAVVLITAMVVSAMTPRYQATATLMLESDKAKLLSIDEIYGVDARRGEYYRTQIEILKSRQIAERVVQRLDLTNHPEFNPEESEKESSFSLREWLPFIAEPEPLDEETAAMLKHRAVVSAVSNNLIIKPVFNTQLINITYEAATPQLAADVANTVAEAYINSQLEAKLVKTQQATTWLNSRMTDLRVKLKQSELDLQAFQEAEGLVDVKGVQGLATQELNEVTTQLVETRQKLNQSASIYNLVKTLGVDIDALANVPEVLNHPLIQNVKQSEIEAARKVSELSRRYGPKHPKMIAANNEWDVMKSRLKNEIRSLVAGIENDYEAAKANERALVG